MENLLKSASTVAVILGAHDWSKAGLTKAPSFRRSAAQLHRYLLGDPPDGLGLRPDFILNLFDDPSAAGAQLARIRDWVGSLVREQRESAQPIRDILIYYVGHGMSESGRPFHILVSDSRQGIEEQTSISAYSLAQVLRVSAPQQRRIAIFDCCFSEAAADAFGAMGQLDEAVASTLIRELAPDPPSPEKGTLLFCSSPRGRTSIGVPTAETTLFTGALLAVLREGNASIHSEMFSFSDLRDAVYDRMLRDFEGSPPRPALHQPDQQAGDLTRLGAFPNKAMAARSSTEVAAKRGARLGGEAEAARVRAENKRKAEEAKLQAEEKRAAAEAKRQKAERARIAAEQEAEELARQKAEEERAAAAKAAELARRKAERDRIAAQKEAEERARQKAEEERLAALKAPLQHGPQKVKKLGTAALKTSGQRTFEKAWQPAAGTKKGGGDPIEAPSPTSAQKGSIDVGEVLGIILVIALMILVPNGAAFLVGRYLAGIASWNLAVMPIARSVLHFAGMDPHSTRGFLSLIFAVSALCGFLTQKILKMFDFPGTASWLVLVMWPGFLVGFRFWSGLPPQTQPSIWYAIAGIATFLLTVLIAGTWSSTSKS